MTQKYNTKDSHAEYMFLRLNFGTPTTLITEQKQPLRYENSCLRYPKNNNFVIPMPLPQVQILDIKRTTQTQYTFSQTDRLDNAK